MDEADYASILSQVKGAEFDAEVSRRLAELHRQQQAEEQARAAKAEQAWQNELFKREQQAVAALSGKDKEIAELKAVVNHNADALRIAVMQEQQRMNDTLRTKENEIAQLKADAQLAKSEAAVRENSIKESYEGKLKAAEEQVAYYKDLKTRLSTKMVGETLEVHCSTIFNGEMRPMFPNAYFEKDNDASGGSKGDFIFRDFVDGFEYISIMFEMKNEMDETATKHKNEDFFKELDKDRKEKNCEYAVLVSLLESESELYNAGIVDVSYKFDKMYVVRPQCFIPIITLLRNAAFTALEYKQELQMVRNQDIDISNFEDSLMKFKNDFSRNYEIAHNHFDKAIDEIDKTIQHLEKVKKELLGSDNQLRIANSKVDDVSVKKLTRGNPTMKAKFEETKGVL